MKERKNNEFGIRLKMNLMHKGITQSDLAKRIGITDVGMSNIIKGKALPSTNTIISICEALEVSSDYLLGLTDEVTR